MSSAGVVIGLALVLAVQVAIHLRISRIPARAAARLKAEAEAEAHARAEMNALEEATVRRVGVLVTELRRFHEALAEEYRAQVGTAQSRARVAEARSTEGAKVMTGLRAHASEVAAIVGELRTLAGDLADLIYTVTEQLAARAPAPEEQPPSAEPGDDGDDRKTTEMGPPSTSEAPSGGTGAAAGATEDADRSSGEAEETQVFTKAAPGAPHEVQVTVPGRPPSPPRAAKGPRAPVPRRAMPPPVSAGEGDSQERRGLLPPAPGPQAGGER